MKCANERCSECKKGCNFGSTECDYFKFPPISGETAKPKASKPKKVAGQRVTEDEVQEAVIQYCQLCKIKVVHIPNEGQRSKSYGGRLKRLGMSPGFPDLSFPTPLNSYHGLYIELKRDEKAKPTPEQLEWIEYLNKQGYYATVCYGVAQAIKVINKYFKVSCNLQ